MPLGRQFRNTFHEGANGAVFHTDLNTVKDKDKLDSKALQKPHTDSKGVPGVAYQGMLMDPYAYTGHRNDPTVSEEERRGAVRDALKLGAENKVEYALNKVPKGQQAPYDASIERTGHESGIPTHMFKENISVPVIAKKTLGRNTGGDYGANHRRHAIRIREGFMPHRELVGSQQVTEPVITRGNYHINPNGVDMLKKDFGKTWLGRIDGIHGDQEYWGSLKNRISNGEAVRGPQGEVSHHDLDNLPEGHGVTLFPGKGKETDEYSVHPVKVHLGYNESWNRTSKTYHYRRDKVPTGETRSYTKQVYKDTPNISGSTLVHEVGHSLDPHVNEPGGYIRGGQDTVKEATADGFEDRFHLHKDNYEEALHPSRKRAAEMTMHGYTVKSKLIATHDTDRALYAAVRQHVSMGDQNYKDVEKRSSLLHASGQEFNMQHGNNRSEGNKLLLGHLYSKHAHVRDILGHLGLSHVGEDAAEHYRSRITDAGKGARSSELYEKGRGYGRNTSQPSEQPTLPGME